ncbi:MAG: hypothetical protein ACE5I0_05055, partial [Candidatus Binatia bacterium]
NVDFLPPGQSDSSYASSKQSLDTPNLIGLTWMNPTVCSETSTTIQKSVPEMHHHPFASAIDMHSLLY